MRTREGECEEQENEKAKKMDAMFKKSRVRRE